MAFIYLLLSSSILLHHRSSPKRTYSTVRFIRNKYNARLKDCQITVAVVIRFQTKSETTSLKLLTCGQSRPDIWLPTYVECDISTVLLLLVYLIPFPAGKLKEKVRVVVGDVMISASLVYKWRPQRGGSWVRPWTYEASLSFLLPCPCSNKLLIGAQRSLVNCCSLSADRHFYHNNFWFDKLL